MASEQDQKYIDLILGLQGESDETAASMFPKIMRDIAREEVASAFGLLMRRAQDTASIASTLRGPDATSVVTVGELERMFGEALQNFSSDSGAPGD